MYSFGKHLLESGIRTFGPVKHIEVAGGREKAGADHRIDHLKGGLCR